MLAMRACHNADLVSARGKLGQHFECAIEPGGTMRVLGDALPVSVVSNLRVLRSLIVLVFVLFDPGIKVATVEVDATPDSDHRQFFLEDQMLYCLLGSPEVNGCFFDIQ